MSALCRQLIRLVHRFYILLGVIFACGVTAAIYAERLPVKTYTVADGLLRDNVYKIKQDSRGFLWFCTAEGVSRFDGYNFTNFTVADGLPSGAVNDFLETRDGSIYLATDGGLAKFNRAQIENRKSKMESSASSLFTVIIPNNPQARAIRVLYEDADAQVWVGTSNGLYQINEQNQLEAVDLGVSRTAEKQILVSAILRDKRGTVWIGTEGGGLFWLKSGESARQFTIDDGLPGNLVASLLEDDNGKLWAGMRPETAAGLVLLNAEPDDKTSVVARSFSAADGLPSDWIPSLFEARSGQIWLGTTSGLCQWQGGANQKSVCQTYTGKNDLCDRDVWSVAEDKDGNLWTGSACGAKKWSRYGFTTYGETDGIKAVQINSIFENRAGELFATVIANRAQSVYRLDGGKFNLVKPRLPTEVTSLGWGWKQTIGQDSAGKWLIPTGSGLFGFAAQTKFEDLAAARPQKISPETMEPEIFRVYEDAHDDYWVATSSHNELWQWERRANAWHDFTNLFDAGRNRIVTAFAKDQSGDLWIGTGADAGGGELIRRRAGQFKIFTANDDVPDGWMRDLYVDHSNRLWLANNKNGLLRLDNVTAEKPKFVRYSTADGLSSAGAYCITEDVYGRIYVGSARGLDRLNPETGQIENFTTADGLPSSFVEVAYRDKNNSLWFATANGLTKYTPEPERKRQPPTVLIIGLRAGGESLQTVSILGETVVSNVELSADLRQVSIDFVGLGASLGEKLKYEYRLGNADWIRATERTVNFASLAPGGYQFEVRAVTTDQIYSSPASVTFRIAAPIWQRPWFVALMLVLVATMGYCVYRVRVARLLEMERVRTRIATDLHDDIGANLTKISILSEVAHQRLGNEGNDGHAVDTGNLLANIAETSRESVSAMSDIVWAINPSKDSLADLTRRMRRHAEELLEQQEILLQFDSGISDLRLDANVRRNVYLIFKECLNNILRHSRATAVRIDFHVEPNALILNIADDGAGFETTTETEGNGLASMQKRAAELGGKLKIVSVRGEGATITLRVELRRKLWTRISEATRQNRRDKK